MSVKIKKSSVLNLAEIKKAKGGYITYIKGKNGEILLTSEILKTQQNAIKNLSSSISSILKYCVYIMYGERTYYEFPNIMRSSFPEFDKLITKIINESKKTKPKTKKAEDGSYENPITVKSINNLSKKKSGDKITVKKPVKKDVKKSK